MHKKRKLKKWVRNILYFIVFAIIGSFIFHYTNAYELIEKKIKKNDINFGLIHVEKFRLKIIDEESKTRPIAVSINNNHDAWPHAGLQDAYTVYELIAEGGITRLLAFYKDKNTTKIGSVRSARHYFLDYVMEHDAIFVHYGYSPQAKEDINTYKINNLNGLYDYNVFYRDTSLNKAYEHTAFTTMKKINNGIKSYKYRTTTEEKIPFNYSVSKVKFDDTKISAKKISIEYSDYQTTSYEYDEENKNYLLFMDGKKHIDAVTNKQYTVKNIITYQVSNSTMGTKGRQELHNIGSGEGYYISNGEAIKIKWSKSSRNSKTIYTKLNGEILKVNDGNTWVHIQPKSKEIKIK